MGASEEFQAEALCRYFERKAPQIILISPAGTESAQAPSLASPALDSSPQNANWRKGEGPGVGTSFNTGGGNLGRMSSPPLCSISPS